MSIARNKTVTEIESGAKLTPVAFEKITPPDGEPANRESLAENFNREIDAWARRALGANGFGDCL